MPRSYANLTFVRISESKGEALQASALSETDIDKLPNDGYIALQLNGYAAPPKWIDTLLAFKTQQDLNMWLVWFIEDTSATANAGIRVAVAYPQRSFFIEPIPPTEWDGKQVIYFERHPSQQMPVPLPEISVVAEKTSANGSENGSSLGPPAN